METPSDLILLLCITTGGIILLTEWFYNIITDKIKKNKSHPPNKNVRVDKEEEDKNKVGHSIGGASRLLVLLLITI